MKIFRILFLTVVVANKQKTDNDSVFYKKSNERKVKYLCLSAKQCWLQVVQAL